MVTFQFSNLQAGKSQNHTLKKTHKHLHSAVYRVRQLGIEGGLIEQDLSGLIIN